MIVNSSVAAITSPSLWLTSATAFLSRSTTMRSASKRNVASDRREHRRRLVEDEHLGVAPEALDDLDPLPHAGRQVADARVGIDLEPVLLADLGHALTDVARVESADVAERHVLPHRERLDEREVLVHHADAVGSSVDRILDLDRLAVTAHLAGVGDDEADQHLHQRRLAGAVLTEDAVDAPGAQGQVDVVAGDDSAEALGDADQLDRRWGGRSLPTGVVTFLGQGSMR